MAPKSGRAANTKGSDETQMESPREYLDRLMALARDGSAQAIGTLAMMYDDGYRDASGRVLVPRRPSQAARLYRRAAELGDTAAMVNWATVLSRSGRRAEAMEFELRAARAGSATAAYNLGVSHKARATHKEAVRWFRVAVSLGDQSALLEVAKAELLAVGTKRNVSRALRALAVVARSKVVSLAENEAACILLAQAYLDGWLIRRSTKRAVRWLRVVAARSECEQAAAMLRDLGPP